jgi:predicted neuraminidase
VLFQPATGPLLLFYKVGPDPRRWWGMVRTSDDGGATWGPPRRLPDGVLGPIKNKPVQLGGGSILCPASTERAGWRVHFERTTDGGATWTTSAPPAGPDAVDAIQPSILVHPAGKLQAVGRTRQGRVFQTWSDDAGATWTPVVLTALPNPNSGTDAVTLADGRHLLVYNPVGIGPGRGGGARSPLGVALSSDGVHWEDVLVLEDEPGQEFSYPAVIQTSDGLVHVTYTWKRQRVKHVVIGVTKPSPKPAPAGGRPR